MSTCRLPNRTEIEVVESYDSIEDLQNRARELRHSGYAVLRLHAGCDHWIGYSAFRCPPEANPATVFKLVYSEKADTSDADPYAIYRDN